MIGSRRKLPAKYSGKCCNRKIKRTDFEQEIFTRFQNLGTSGEVEIKCNALDYEKQIERID